MSSVPTRNAGNVQAPAKTCFAAHNLARTSRRGDAKHAFTFDSVKSLRCARTQIKKKVCLIESGLAISLREARHCALGM